MNQRAKAALDGTRFADLRWVTETGSTNADLVEAARHGAGECALVSDHQRSGRGRLDRRWEAPPGASLLMSVLVRPPFPPEGPHLLVVALAVAAVEAVEQLTGLRTALKWPNDVVELQGAGPGPERKLGGLLAEWVPAVDGAAVPGDAVVVGIGLNSAWAGTGFPPDLAATATSLDLLGVTVDRGDLAATILRAFADGPGLAGTTQELLARYRELCSTLGRRVRVDLPGDEALVGHATDVTSDGSLLVLSDAGDQRVVGVGDVVHLRPQA